jgi:hypothetical protein
MRSRSTEHSQQHLDFDYENDSGHFDDSKATLENNDDSERVTQPPSVNGSKRQGLHRRAMSDPFDTAESGGITDDDLKHIAEGSTEEEASALPTLPRFPVAETRDKNCWSEPSVSIFRVRGENYFCDKKKITSDPYILRARGCDLFLADDPQKCVIGG